MRSKFILGMTLCAFVLGLSGCNVGNPPSGMSGEEAKDYIDKMPPDRKIRAIAGSPMPQAEKEQRYAEIEKETGVKASDVLGQAGGPPMGAQGTGR
ncbi:MAG TPA: hypothetical protein VGE01_08520 [Fimbriimonas sp.]